MNSLQGAPTFRPRKGLVFSLTPPKVSDLYLRQMWKHKDHHLYSLKAGMGWDDESGVTMPLRVVWLGCGPGGRSGTSPGPADPMRNLVRPGTDQLASLLGLALGQELLV